MDLSDGLKKVFLAGVGAVATTTEAAKDLVDQLVKKGELTVEQGKVLNEELKHNVKEKVNDHVTVKIIKEYKDVMNAVDHMNKEERDQLRERLDAADAADQPEASETAPETADSEAVTQAPDEDAPAEAQEAASEEVPPAADALVNE
mgnify:CR=1 FL=1